MFRSRFMPCRECGASVDRETRSEHVCDPVRMVDFQLFALRTDVGRLDESLAAFLDSPTGRFEVWHARRAVRRRRAS